MLAGSFLPHVTTGITKTVAGRERAKAASSSISGSSTGSSFTLPQPRKTKETKGPAGKRLCVHAVGSTGEEPEEDQRRTRGERFESRVCAWPRRRFLPWLDVGSWPALAIHRKPSSAVPTFACTLASPFLSCSFSPASNDPLLSSLSLSLSICLSSSSLSSLLHTWTPGQASSPVRSLFFFVSILS